MFMSHTNHVAVVTLLGGPEHTAHSHTGHWQQSARTVSSETSLVHHWSLLGVTFRGMSKPKVANNPTKAAFWKFTVQLASISVVRENTSSPQQLLLPLQFREEAGLSTSWKFRNFLRLLSVFSFLSLNTVLRFRGDSYKQPGAKKASTDPLPKDWSLNPALPPWPV